MSKKKIKSPSSTEPLPAGVQAHILAMCLPFPDHYVDREEYGEGARGKVWLMLDSRSGDRVIGKVFANRDRLDFDHLAAKLRHPNIPQILDLGDGWAVLKYVDGGNLEKLLNPTQKRRVRLDPVKAVQLLLPIADAVACANESGLAAHSDLKPANILIGKDGRPHVTDWGFAFVEGARMIGRTLPYAAPEQLQGQCDHRSDIYTLGLILFEMICGDLPKKRSENDIRRSLVHACPRIDLAVTAICQRCLQAKPSARFQSARELRDALEAWLDKNGGWPPDWPYPLAPLCRDANSGVVVVRYPQLTSAVFTGAACELEHGRLVVAPWDNRLAVFGCKDAGYAQQKSIDLLFPARTVAAIGPSEILALVDNERCGRLQVWDVNTDHCRHLAGDLGHVVACAVLPGPPSVLGSDPKVKGFGCLFGGNAATSGL